MQKTAPMSYDYATCKRSLECVFGLVLGKIKFLEQVRISRQSSGPLKRKWSVKITCGSWYLLMVQQQKVILAPGACTGSAMLVGYLLRCESRHLAMVEDYEFFRQ
ncbi:hypothetical protein TNCV_716631 [Trichonephila clavipes]|nr:hypothetical protein TNCV_716631 [Trichonephila clavipes]